MRRPIAFAVLPGLAMLMSAGGAQAGTGGGPPTVIVAQNTASDGAISGYLGQSFVAGTSGMNYNKLNFYYTDPSGNAVGSGNAYLFSTPYGGTPNSLGSSAQSTPGFVASAFAVQNSYTFAPTVTLTGGSTYYAYTDAQMTTAGASGQNPYGGGILYYASSGDTGYSGLNTYDADFRITGTATAAVSAAPEPGTWVMMILGFGIAGTTLRRRRPATFAPLRAAAV